MEKKAKFLKNLLATASVAAVIAGGVETAFAAAAARDVVAAGANLAGQNLDQNKTPVDVVLDDGSTVRFNFNNAVLDLQAAAANFRIAGVDMVTNGTIKAQNVANALSLGSVKGAGKLTLEFQAANNVTLDGKAVGAILKGLDNKDVAWGFTTNADDYSAFGKVDFKGNDGTLTINPAGSSLTLNTEIVSTGAAGNGNVVVSKNKEITFANGIGGAVANAVKSLKVEDGGSATLGKNSFFNSNNGGAGGAVINVGSGSSLNVSDGANLTATAKDYIDATTADKGTVTFAGKSTVTNLHLGNTGNAGRALAEVKIDGAVELKDNSGIRAKAIKVGVDGVLKFSDQANGHEVITESITGSGVIDVNADTEITGLKVIGEDKARFANINFSADKSLSVSVDATTDLNFYVSGVSTKTNGKGVLSFSTTAAGKAINIYSDIGNENTKLKDVRIEAGVASPMTLRLKEGVKVYSKEFDLSVGQNTNNILELENNTLIDGAVVTNNANQGIIKVKGDSKITGNIGANGANIDSLIFDTEGKTLEFGGTEIFAQNPIDFQKDAGLSFTNKNNITVANKIQLAAGDNGVGTISANNLVAGKTLKIDNVVGDIAANKSLKLLEVKGGGKAEIALGSYIKEVAFGDADSSLKVNANAAGNVKLNITHADGKGTLELDAQNITLKTGSKISTGEAALKKVVFGGDKTYSFEDGINIYATEGLKSSKANEGTLVFEGNHVIDAVVGVNTSFKGIQVTGKDKTAHFKKKINLDKAAAAITLGDGATAVIYDEVVAKEVIGNNPGGKAGTLVFANGAVREYAFNIGQAGTYEVSALKFGGENVTIKGDANAVDAVDFYSTSPVTVTFEKSAVDMLKTAEITTNGNAVHNLALVGNQQFDGKVGTAENAFGNMIFAKDETVVINTDKFYASVVNNHADAAKVSVEFTQNGVAFLITLRN